MLPFHLPVNSSCRYLHMAGEATVTPSVTSGMLSGLPSWEVRSQDPSPGLLPVCSWCPCWHTPSPADAALVTQVHSRQSPGQPLVPQLHLGNRPSLPAPEARGQHSPHLSPRASWKPTHHRVRLLTGEASWKPTHHRVRLLTGEARDPLTSRGLHTRTGAASLCPSGEGWVKVHPPAKPVSVGPYAGWCMGLPWWSSG